MGNVIKFLDHLGRQSTVQPVSEMTVANLESGLASSVIHNIDALASETDSLSFAITYLQSSKFGPTATYPRRRIPTAKSPDPE